MLGRMIVKASQEYDVPGLTLLASEHSHQTQVAAGFPQRLLSPKPLVFPDGVTMFVAWVEITTARPAMLGHLEGLRAMANNPAVARELPVLEPFIRGVATGEGYDEFIDMNPR